MTFELLRAAPIVAVVSVSSPGRMHWNNLTNSEWRSDEMARMPMIYRDQDVTLVRILKGEMAASEMIRSVGGAVGQVTMVSEPSAELKPNRTYLLFLRREASVTQEGTEPALMVYGQGGGVFENVDGAWLNTESGVVIDERQVVVGP